MKRSKFWLLIAGLVTLSCTNQHNEAQSMNNNDSTKANPNFSLTDTAKLTLSNEEWRSILPPDLYHIAREKGTEYAFSGRYNDFDALGRYHCAACGNYLFDSDAKFASTCGWPSFFKAKSPSSVLYIDDYSHGMYRIEVQCGRCDAHLGHIFDDGPAPTGKRYCMNSISLIFIPFKAE